MIKTDESRDVKKSLSNEYTIMMNTPAWKHLEKYAHDEREMSMKRVDVKAASDLSLGEVCEERGIRKGILKLIQYADQCKEGV